MTYKHLVSIINWLIRIANAIRLLKCRKSGECLCLFCNNQKCRNRGITVDKLIIPEEEEDYEESCQ